MSDYRGLVEHLGFKAEWGKDTYMGQLKTQCARCNSAADAVRALLAASSEEGGK